MKRLVSSQRGQVFALTAVVITVATVAVFTALSGGISGAIANTIGKL